MSLNTTPMYSLRDIAIIPAKFSHVSSRSDVNPYCYSYYTEHDIDKTLPIFTAPMSAVVNLDNVHLWEQNNIIPIIPRNIDFNDRIEYIKRGYWVAVSLSEFEQIYENIISYFTINNYIKILIDIANGHMNSLYDKYSIIRKMKEDAFTLGKFVYIMVGNIANPETVKDIANMNYEYDAAHKNSLELIDYIRVGIGSGACCSSTSETSIHFGMASLLNEIYESGYYSSFRPKIIADGGIKTYNDAITALALGADYVMIGTTLASLFESAGEIINKRNNPIYKTLYLNTEENEKDKREFLSKTKVTPIKYVYGMSTYVAQEETKHDKTKIRLTEGIGRHVECRQTIKQWTEGFEGYLRSCMSYCGTKDISQFIGKVNCRVMSPTLNSVINQPIDSYINDNIHIIK